MRENQIICGYVANNDGELLIPGAVQRPERTLKTLAGNHKRAYVTFPVPEEDPMDWLGPLATPESEPQEGALFKVPAENPHDQFNPRIGKVTYLVDYPYAPQAEAIMRKVALLVRPIMEEHKWTVCHLTEMYPQDPVPDRCHGVNTNRGEIIFVRLREIGDKAVFLEFEEILNTVLHELIHNWYDGHHGDFAALWYDLALRFGASIGSVTKSVKSTTRPTQHPKGHISIFLSGTRFFLSEEAYKKHFSIWAERHREQDEQTLQSGQKLSEFRSVYINRKFRHDDYCVYARLIQVAKGLDPAINKPIHELPNAEEFRTHTGEDENDGESEQDVSGDDDDDDDDESDDNNDKTFYDIHDLVDTEATWALDLYLDLFRVGTECGMHVSTKDWLIEQVTHLSSWGPEIDGEEWHQVFRLAPESFYEGLMWPFPDDPKEASILLAEFAGKIYDATTIPEGQCLRELAVARMRAIAANSVQAARYFDLDYLSKLIKENEEFKIDLDAAVAQDQQIQPGSSQVSGT